SPAGDADATAAAVNARGRAAVAFVEWRDRTALLRVATRAVGGWQVATLERSTEPIWSPRVVVSVDGTTVATWIANTGPARAVRIATRPPGGVWQRPVTLENADGLGTVALASRGDLAVAAWHDSVARESRVRAATYTHGRWAPAVTLA